MVRRGSHPRLSVILIVEGSPSYAMRALESIQNQDLYDLQIVIACRDVAPGVRHSLEVAAGRDIHIDLIDVEGGARDACLRAGFDASRGSNIAVMNADEWFAPHALAKMLDVACDGSADIVCPCVSLDRYDVHRERHSRVLDASGLAVEDRGSLGEGITQMVMNGLICQTSGVLYSRSVFEAPLQCDAAFGMIAFSAAAVSRAQCIMGCGDATFHAPAPSITVSFDPTMFTRLSDDAKALDDLVEAVVPTGDNSRLVLACQRFYYARLVACIENLCLSPHGVSSIERTARLRDMLEAARTRKMAAALKGDHRGLGLLFGPIASARPARCAMYTHLSAFFSRTGVKTA